MCGSSSKSNQGKSSFGKEGGGGTRLSFFENIALVWKATGFTSWRTGRKSQANSSFWKMEAEASKGGPYSHPALWSWLRTPAWSTTGTQEEKSGGSPMALPYCKAASNGMRTQMEFFLASNPTSLQRHRGCLAAAAAATAAAVKSKHINSAATEEETSCEYGSTMYLVLCALGGIVSCGATHTAVVPLDIVKCRMQVEPLRYRGLFQGIALTVQEEGPTGLLKGWAPTAIGYSMQGLCKFGLYEFFKIYYSNLLGPEQTYLWRTSLYLAASASAEFFADIALAPMEAMKVRIQTQKGYANTLREAAPKMHQEEGLWAFYKGVSPLWMRQIPYTMMKFACFERTVEALYKYVVPKPREKCSKMEQLGVTFVGGYIAGVFCAVVSHPADSVVSVLNKEKGSTAMDVLKRLGMYGIWKGLFTRILMIGTLTALQWFIYDSVKVYLKLPRPPPPEMPESLKRKLSEK